MLAARLTHDEPKLVYLALVYHLGRPGSELDPATNAPMEHGLSEVEASLRNELSANSAVVELDDWQYDRLLSAIKGCVTEFRVYHMREGAESTVTKWTETAESLFSNLKSDREAGLELAQAMMMLHRRLERALKAGWPSRPSAI
jgi:hypothetical protein